MAIVSNPADRFWRTDYRLGRNIYVLISNDEKRPSQDDPLIGTMETSELAEMVVETHNRSIQRYGRHFLKVMRRDVDADG